jgi:SnoaL-like protein
MADQHHIFRRAAETHDAQLLAEAMCEDVVLHSPILFRGFEGRDVVIQVLNFVGMTLEEFTYLDDIAEGDTVFLRFKAKVGERELEGIDLLKLDEDGRVAELTVFMRPLSAITAFNEKMAAHFAAAESPPASS